MIFLMSLFYFLELKDKLIKYPIFRMSLISHKLCCFLSYVLYALDFLLLRLYAKVLNFLIVNRKNCNERDRTRTSNPQIQSLVPYSLGHTTYMMGTNSSVYKLYRRYCCFGRKIFWKFWHSPILENVEQSQFFTAFWMFSRQYWSGEPLVR